VLESGWRVEIGLRAAAWMREMGQRMRRGFAILIDYGHEARELYSVTHAGGTLTTFTRHVSAGAEAAASEPPWLQRPAEQDLTAHVDFTTLRRVAGEEGFVALGYLDQTYFVLGLLLSKGVQAESLKDRLALKTLLMPGGLGSTMKVLLLGKNVGTPPTLSGCSYRARAT
jgi:SAM-dependent MidA family methyltransferase